MTDLLNIILNKMPNWIHPRDTEGRTALHYAASVGYEKGVDYGFFPLHLASYAAHVEVVQQLLKQEYSLEPTETLDKDGRNILHLAVEGGKFRMVRHILQSTDTEVSNMINGQDANGNTPLHLATLHCLSKIVHALTWDKRVNLNLVNKRYQTALAAFKPSPNPSFRQQLTRSALMSAGMQSKNSILSSPIKIPPPGEKNMRKCNNDSRSMEPYKDRINTLMLVSTLIVTTAFSATVPGGTNSSDPGQGMALMLNRIWFKLFIFCNTVSMYGAFIVTIILIWAQLGDITLALLALKVASTLLGITVATLCLAFLAAVHLVISDLSWLATSSLVLGLLFIFLLLLLYILLWFPSSSRNPVVRYISYYPFLLLASVVEPDED
ncbi:protein ACCELERATED CELL DEATH 6-like [Abrus precatorius]|uniref:Protein ACCELERATED CELL DEATH 6-like n=1 Tax=Abrus precatorius TaxID=3816 RepID=A0A8B8KX63_ABRPR|nr:protein ACCELERATED CELL DEATH 6-like [Abrus precatorius]